ncbi:MAG: ADP-heptose:LPS heptosyltransferase-like protein [Chthoniobacteraceae bacterium]|nr:ADP-heptose:LPS heptosyltransferase-like protein [Chthoniobacteraceae bacterium]
MLTAAIEALHVQHPGRFLTDVRTPCPALFEHSPYITPLLDAEARHIECHYPLIQQSNQLPYHFIHGYVRHLAGQLGIFLEPAAFRGNIHLHSAELAAPSLVKTLTGSEEPYWIVCAGGKYDFTIKWWHRRRWQEVVDHFHGRLRFVQTGEKGHYHPPLQNVVDARGATTLRELLLLVYHAAGVLCPVTLLMHLAAAVPTGGGLRPCVVVAGGREPPHWEAYPGHRFLHTVGALPCCSNGGCWRARTVPVGDNAENDAPARLCLRPQPSGLPECMEMIEPRHVIDAIEWHCRPGKPDTQPIYSSTRHESERRATYS